MKKLTCIASLVTITALLLLGCLPEAPEFTAPQQQGESQSPEMLLNSGTAPVDTINSYVVQFDGRVFDGTRTTFTYTVTGTGVGPALSGFRVELPPCAPAVDSFSPTNSVSINTMEETGIFGIEWQLSVQHDDPVGRTYSVSFLGDVPLGEVHAVVQSGDDDDKRRQVADDDDDFEVGIIPGPCQGFDISGTVFVDTDTSGVRDGLDETGIPNVTVSLVDSDGNVDCITTAGNCAYSFRKLDGDFTVFVELATPADDFNEQLAENFDVTTPLSIDVTVGPNSLGNDFGFAPQAGKIINDIETGVLLTTGESVKFWKKQLRAAIHSSGGAEFPAAVTAVFIDEIQNNIGLPDPYQFTPGSEFEEALAILASNSKDLLDILRKELLATDFNHVAGKGLEGQDAFQLVLISWGESLVFDNTPASGIGALAASTTGFLEDAGDTFNRINGGRGTGGGGDDE